jgi:hypothetical protein
LFNLTGERQPNVFLALFEMPVATAKNRNPSQVEVHVILVALGCLGVFVHLGWHCCH